MSYMQYFQVLCILLSAVMIYLLTKLIIEKNETATTLMPTQEAPITRPLFIVPASSISLSCTASSAAVSYTHLVEQGRTAGVNMAGGHREFGANVLVNLAHYLDYDFISIGDLSCCPQSR